MLGGSRWNVFENLTMIKLVLCPQRTPQYSIICRIKTSCPLLPAKTHSWLMLNLVSTATTRIISSEELCISPCWTPEIPIGPYLKFHKVLQDSISTPYKAYETLSIIHKYAEDAFWFTIWIVDNGRYQPQYHQRTSHFIQDGNQVGQAWAEVGKSTLTVLNYILVFHMFEKGSIIFSETEMRLSSLCNPESASSSFL